MLQRADILLLDEPTNHLDVINVAWVKNYINSLTHVTAIMVSHDSGFLNDCCTHILAISSLKLTSYKVSIHTAIVAHAVIVLSTSLCNAVTAVVLCWIAS
jgi:elongation factor 3